MTDNHDLPELHDLFVRTTDRVSSPNLAGRALAVARRRRAIAHGALVAGVATVALVISLTQVGRFDSAPPLAPSTSSMPPTPSVTTQPTPSPSTPPTRPTLDPSLVQAQWDPRNVDDLPAAKATAPELPRVVTPPESAPLLAGSPLASAVLSVDRGSTIELMAPDGAWRSVPVPDQQRPAASPASLSPSGTRLAVPATEGVEVWDLPSGASTPLGLPHGFKQWDFTAVEWVDDQTLLFDDYAGGWLVDIGTGSFTRVPFPTQSTRYWWTLDADGTVVESADYSMPAVLTDWRGGEPHEVSMAATGRLLRPEVSRDSVVGMTLDGAVEGFAVIAADRSDLAPRAVLPVRDHDGNYSNWALSTVTVRDDGTVLLWTAVPGPSAVDGWRLVAWEPRSGALSVVMRSDADPTWSLSFAKAILR